VVRDFFLLIILQKLIDIWSSEEETSRVIALRCIIRLVLHIPEKLVEPSFKVSYLPLSITFHCQGELSSITKLNYFLLSIIMVDQL